MIRTVRYGQIATATGRELALSEIPGIYAWYREANFERYLQDPNGLEQAIITSLGVQASDSFAASAGYLYRLTVVEKPKGLSEQKRKTLGELVQSEEGRRALIDHLRLASQFFAPLYVGKALDMRQRIAEHVQGESSLTSRLEAAGIELSQCVVKVIYLDRNVEEQESDYVSVDNEQFAFLVEDIVTRMAPSAFVRRPG